MLHPPVSPTTSADKQYIFKHFSNTHKPQTKEKIRYVFNEAQGNNGVILTIALLKSKVRDALSINSKAYAEEKPNTFDAGDSFERYEDIVDTTTVSTRE